MEPYKYAELRQDKSEIRLLHLEPGQPSAARNGADPIHCFISYVSLDDKPAYTAISYRWSGEPRAILIRGSGTQHRLRVCANLEAALCQIQRHMQTSQLHLPIWADAICINQEDDTEKSWQVGMMRRVYEQAALTLVWLGEDDGERGEFALQKLRGFGDAYMSRQSPTRYFAHSDRDPFRLVEKAGELRSDMLDDLTRLAKVDGVGQDAEQAWAAIALLLQREYWTRVWMIQEIALSPMVFILCGREVINGFYLAVAVTLFQQHFNWPGLLVKVQRGEPYSNLLWWIASKLMIGTQAMFMTRLLLSGSRGQRDAAASSLPYGHRSPLANLLCVAYLPSARFFATNRSDLVYALLSLSSDVDELGVSPDYSLSDSELYSNVARSLLTKQQHAWVLSLNHHAKAIPDLPSWVPDWSVASPCVPLQRSRIHQITSIFSTTPIGRSAAPVPDEEFDASRGLPASEYPPCQSPRLLALKVVFMDEIATVGNCYSELGLEGERLEKGRPDSRTQLWLLELHRLLSGCSVGEEAGYQSARIARAAMTGHDIQQTTSLTGISPGTTLGDVAPLVPEIVEGLLRQGTEHLYLPLSGVIYTYCRNRRAFLTSKGSLGVGPLDTQVGDAAAVVTGARVPFLMRRAAERRWQLVGEAFVEGLMNGESFDNSPAVELIELC